MDAIVKNPNVSCFIWIKIPNSNFSEFDDSWFMFGSNKQINKFI
jgi:hypothetical protein